MSEYTPFKMKGSPMQRNFGIGSPAKDTDPHTGENPKHTVEDHDEEGELTLDDVMGAVDKFGKKGSTKVEMAGKAASKVTPPPTIPLQFKSSPAKCPLVALIPMAMSMLGDKEEK